MIAKWSLFLMGCSAVAVQSQAQVLSTNSATLYVNTNGVLFCNGGVFIGGTSSVTNKGTLTTTKNATSPGPGNFTVAGNSVVAGDGDYYVEQDWQNDATFTAQASEVHLNGATEQLITSSNGTVTEFNVLTLSGNGVGVNRRKTLNNVDARISSTGLLNLNDRELYTQGNEMTVLNTSPSAITNNLSFGAEGFVSSDFTGNLGWYTASSSDYIFPVGSSNGVLRYRPLRITPFSNASNLFKAHLNNDSGDNYAFPLSQHDIDIASANNLFFHSIIRPIGSSSADISIAYDPDADGDWSTSAQWRFANSIWNWMGETAATGIGSYSAVTKADWDFADNSHPFILANPENQLIIPNVFTPNNDGSNDLYYITSKNIDDFHIVIVNRWGETVFEADDIKTPWDGTTNGRLCNDGTYFYVIRAQSNGSELVKQGFITLNAH